MPWVKRKEKNMYELNEKIKEALLSINFIERYEKLSNLYNDEKTASDERLIYIDGEEVMDTIRDLGYDSKFDSREKFYKLKEEKVGNYIFGFHIILYNGTVELIWDVKENDKVLLGSPWGTYAKRLIDPSYIIKKPIIGDYDDLECVLKEAFIMFEDFKKAILS